MASNVVLCSWVKFGDKLIGQLLLLFSVESSEQAVELRAVVVNLGQALFICRSAMFVKHEIDGFWGSVKG